VGHSHASGVQRLLGQHHALDRARFLQLLFAKLLYAEFQQPHAHLVCTKMGNFAEERVLSLV
jgi:Fe2+ or Zn2+ uptake regulation protein